MTYFEDILYLLNTLDENKKELVLILKEQILKDWSSELDGKFFVEKKYYYGFTCNSKHHSIYIYLYRSKDGKKQYYAFGSKHKVIGLFKETNHIWSSIKNGSVYNYDKFCKICGISRFKSFSQMMTCDENLIKDIVI